MAYKYIFITVVFLHCNFKEHKSPLSEKKSTLPTSVHKKDSTATYLNKPLQGDLLKITPKEISWPENMDSSILAIQENFQTINAKTKWAKTKRIDLYESTEGGEAIFYSDSNTIQKIVVHLYGEMYQEISEYYVKNNQLSFVYEKDLKYNRPIYWDSLNAMECGDTTYFDIEKSEIYESRSYFVNEQLIKRLESGDCGAPFAKEYLIEEQKRLFLFFEYLLNQY